MFLPPCPRRRSCDRAAIHCHRHILFGYLTAVRNRSGGYSLSIFRWYEGDLLADVPEPEVYKRLKDEPCSSSPTSSALLHFKHYTATHLSFNFHLNHEVLRRPRCPRHRRVRAEHHHRQPLRRHRCVPGPADHGRRREGQHAVVLEGGRPPDLDRALRDRGLRRHLRRLRGRRRADPVPGRVQPAVPLRGGGVCGAVPELHRQHARVAHAW